ncbi:DNA circularization protein [Komagataeibacter medellinensis]|uniref:Bacteriophage DNA circulation protein, Mu-like n=1 Tax=Komagataeibacter medellinensis (strain NBRC 3288 / BCRC 11682 / LMG 1693 / Kondo 51) TaxID=634177 RepID=G2I773_KOMMN|nr:DNA circularization N-terminal domain-containing protein [Komagataeibacter medellinensis]BAK83970.1 bacteriophage DNA circulation protein, Mu-like [Komagataeibacter medellinensis NBRC 3288]
MSVIDLFIPAIWRGVPFLVREGSLSGGRRTAVHEYPYRDDPWPEDMGRAPRVMTLAGRLVGDDVYLQRAALLAACELEGPGLLIHPTLGPVQCSLVEPVQFRDRGEAQREVQFDLVLMQAGSRLYPNLLINTQNAILVAVAAAVLAVADVLASQLASIKSTASAVSLGAQNVASAWGAGASAAGRDPAAIANETSGLTSYNGRYAGGMLAAPAPANATVASQRAAVITSRTAIDAAVAALSTAALSAVSDPAACATAARAVVVAIRAATISPADQIRVLSTLAGYQPSVMATTAPIGADVATAQTAMGNALRRSAIIGLAEAVEAAQPDSAEQAQAMLVSIITVLDAEIITAADSADSESYAALRALRTTVVQDLSERGAQLAHIETFTFNASMPAITLAWRLYKDPTRTRDLVARADCPHPLFMPLQFEALDQ